MAEIIVFHHAHGLTDGVRQFAEELTSGGHIVHLPDLYAGQTFARLEDGIAYAKKVGFESILSQGVAAAEQLPASVVYVGFSLGVMPAQKLAQTRPGARGGIFISGCLPLEEFGSEWPPRVPVQIHAMEQDPFFEEDLPAAQHVVDTAGDSELFLYPGKDHLFTDNSLPSFHDEFNRQVMARVRGYLGNLS